MAIAEVYTGTANANTTTVTSLTANAAGPQAVTTDGVYQAFIDLTNMGFDDRVTIRVWETVIAGASQNVVYESILTGPQVEPIWVSPSLILLHGWDVTIVANTGFTPVTWSIRQVA